MCLAWVFPSYQKAKAAPTLPDFFLSISCVCEIKYIYPAASSPTGLWQLLGFSALALPQPCPQIAHIV